MKPMQNFWAFTSQTGNNGAP